jgi:hypothetical protein
MAAIAPQRQQPAAHEQQLPDSMNCWEPAIATGPNGQVYVVAGRRRGTPKDKDSEQRQVIWRSQDRGVSFEAPVLTPRGNSYFEAHRRGREGHHRVLHGWAPDERAVAQPFVSRARARAAARFRRQQ